VHEAEQHYDELRHASSSADIEWDRSQLLAELAGVQTTLQRYARINDITLGRAAANQRSAGAERYLTIDKQHIQESLHRLETVNTSNLHELVSVRNAVRKMLRMLGTEPLVETLSDVLESMPALAEDLGKEAPVITIDDGGYVVHSHSSGMLKNVFMHLIRNAMDHGLEKPEVRVAQGKPAAGAINLDMAVFDGMLRIALTDDGRGLALGRIRKTAGEMGLIDPAIEISDEEAARLIMRPGFSTTETVTEVSGRGVGMDAVLDFVTRENGMIDINFKDDAAGADFRPFTIVVSLPANFAVEIDGDDYPLETKAADIKIDDLNGSEDEQVA
jgi:two-component system chemotaxis sensor kinase CheA